MIKNDLGIGIPTTVEWEPWNGSGKCPRCFGGKLLYNTRVVLTTQPAQTLLRCRSCAYEFGNLALVQDQERASVPTPIPASKSTCRVCGGSDRVVGHLCDECAGALKSIILSHRLQRPEAETAETASNEASATVTADDSNTSCATEEADVATPETATPKKRSTYKRKTPSTEG